MSLIHKILYWVYLAPFRLYLKADQEHRYHGPVKGSELTASKLEELHNYRMNFYKFHLPYLFPQTEEAKLIEREKDLRSYQIWSEDERGMIVGSCMFTPFPFEITPVIGTEANLAHQDHLEITRLLVTKQRCGIGMRLLFQAGPHIVPGGTFKGIIGICKPIRLSMFSLVGMKVIGEVTLKERNSQSYKVISASMMRLTLMMNLLALKGLFIRPQVLNWSVAMVMLFVAFNALAY